MRKPIDLDSESALEAVVPRLVTTSGDNPFIMLRRESAGNDPTYEDAKVSDAEAWARHALAANGFGDGARVGDGAMTDASSAWSTSYGLYHAARAHRSFNLGKIIVAVMQAVAAIARQALARYAQHQRARSTYDALSQLDDRTLRDLGFDRSEIRSVVAELAGKAECTRMRTTSRS
jgi:uncharacterized protein YjiS (DUF1127 family)